MKVMIKLPQEILDSHINELLEGRVSNSVSRGLMKLGLEPTFQNLIDNFDKTKTFKNFGGITRTMLNSFLVEMTLNNMTDEQIREWVLDMAAINLDLIGE